MEVRGNKPYPSELHFKEDIVKWYLFVEGMDMLEPAMETLKCSLYN